MATNDNDTDPSTPSARRSTGTGAEEAGAPGPASVPASVSVSVSSPRPRGLNDTQPLAVVPHPATPAAGGRPSTHPGLGPPPPRLDGVEAPDVGVPREAPARPMGIVVPVAAPDAKKDSVELLLDGITGPQPERTKTMPQTDGQAAASYHARHDVRPARTSPDDEPKVVVERPILPPTVRIDRTQIPAPDPAMSRAAAESTVVVPPQMGPRVVLAVIAGLLVVLGLFVTARFAINRRAHATHAASSSVPAATALAPTSALASAPAAAVPAPPPEPVPAPPPPELDTPPASVTSAAGLPAVPASAAPPATAPAAPTAAQRALAAQPKAKPRTSSAAPAPSPDLGELKTTFH
jgi:hypothetical protein